MIFRAVVCLTLLFGFDFPALAVSHGPLALGIIAGQPTGLNARYRISASNAVDASLGWGVWSGIHVDGAYVWRFPKAFNTPDPNFEWYVGIGGKIATWEHRSCGIRSCDNTSSGVGVSVHIPVGLSYRFQEAPIEIFGHLAPNLMLIPGTAIDVDAALGVRFYF